MELGGEGWGAVARGDEVLGLGPGGSEARGGLGPQSRKASCSASHARRDGVEAEDTGGREVGGEE
ncbi:hypothetical protein E2562_008166 [Oryza meyeriana var. granulata]|uniref:Uncharacterized protein n=1 Tax=Oryza meyeriana var. granulata TaxID=110450 RepID=A0A6G1CEK7_9ORYZ|nr:hypothetical protein E2562_008166 [Oryza meyeriana var. granulata]